MPAMLRELTLATVAKSTCPESVDRPTLLPKAVHALPGFQDPQEAVEHSRMSELKRKTNWNWDIAAVEYNWTGTHTCDCVGAKDSKGPSGPPRS